jgi:hypothetical protein
LRGHNLSAGDVVGLAFGVDDLDAVSELVPDDACDLAFPHDDR